MQNAAYATHHDEVDPMFNEGPKEGYVVRFRGSLHRAAS